MCTEGRKIVDHILECEKPSISAVNGYAMGLGANDVLVCDVVIAGPNGCSPTPT
jgi:enoyl-CoA hydratase/carnithine racemase